jgi:hypothetical protein
MSNINTIIQNQTKMGITNPTPRQAVDIRKVKVNDAVLNPLIEEHKHQTNQGSLFG